MPSQPVDTGWDFNPVFGLIDSYGSPGLSPEPRALYARSTPKKPGNQEQGGGISLGSFGKLWQELGIPDDSPLPELSTIESGSDTQSNSDDALPPLPDPVEKKLERSEHDVPGLNSALKKPGDPIDDGPYAGLNKKQRNRARKLAEKDRKSSKQQDREAVQKEAVQREIPRKDIYELANSNKADVLAKNLTAVSTPRQSRTQPRSNVSAKIRPATPSIPDSSATISKETETLTVAPAPRAPPMPTSILKRETPMVPATPQVVKPAARVTSEVVENGPLPPHVAGMEHDTIATPDIPATPTPNPLSIIPRQVNPTVVRRQAQAPQTPKVAVVRQQMHVGQTPSRFAGPIHIRSQVERHHHLFNRLMADFPEDKRFLVSPKQLCNEKTAAAGIHVFVDASNIMIGFNDLLRENGISGFDLSFDSLVLLMERRRPVAKRIFAGSQREAVPQAHILRLVETSKEVGYENNVNEQVYIRRDHTAKKKFFDDVKRLGWVKAQRRTGSGSDSETGLAPTTPVAPKWVEQGVDEILHLKMCQSIIDTETPSTIVLATGDGAEAEHSDGFKAHVERALKKGWRVELVSWSRQTSGGYRNKKFRAKWGEAFRIVELDTYLESLLDTPDFP